MADAWSALVGAFIGALAGIGSGIALEAFKRYRDRVGTASALVGEIASILESAKDREVDQACQNLVLTLKSGDDQKIPMMFGDARSPDPIITQHIGKLGLLGDDLPERVATFYTRMLAIRSDWARLIAADLDGKPAQKALIVEANARLWKHAAEQATVLLKDLKALAARKHWISFGWWFK